MKRYERYKDSGVEWLGEVPEHWEVKRLGTWFDERKTKVSDKDYAPLSVTKIGILPQLESAAKTNDGDNRKLVLSGDYVINSRSDRKGSSGLSALDGSVSLINIVIQPRNIHSKFCEYIFKSDSFVEEYYKNGHGIVADLWTTRYDEMKNIPLAYPPLAEQEQIVVFLGNKCAKIDKAVEQKERMIELLNERRQIIIQRTVTRGLSSDAPLRDSGIDWIGQIPSHWQIKRLKTISKKIGDGLHGTPIYDITGSCYFINGNNLGENLICITERTNTINTTERNKYFIPFSNNTIFISLNGTIGNISFYNKENVILGKSAGYIMLNDLENKYYIKHYLSSKYLKDCYFNTSLMGTTIGNLSLETVRNTAITYPPIKEQQQIADYLDYVNEKTEKAISLKKQEIEQLKEYKQTLINSAVTGKIKIE